ncbi:hypothetical protein J2W34_005620 [Variovorax boronicumulans]|nr:hypothetical protein [Variovorax boronicumulans]MDQ0073800.1 hypothetical protein [Variovorax boronicumulans]
MDIVWMGALLALWVVVAAMVVGLNRLEGSNPPKSSSNGEAS